MTEQAIGSLLPSSDVSDIDDTLIHEKLKNLEDIAVMEPETPSIESTVQGDITENIATGTEPSMAEHAENTSTALPDVEHAELESGSKEQKEYVLLEFEEGWVPAPNTPFSLSGLDTLNPVLEFADGTKMVGHYEETIGTCILFTEDEKAVQDEAKSKIPRKELAMEPNPLYMRTFAIDDATKQDEYKAPQPFCILHKKLKFRPLESDVEKKNYL